MAYVETPKKTDSKSKSQGEIKTNFAAIKTLIDIDHETFDIADTGKHKKVTLTELATDPTTLANEMALYIKDSGTEPNLYLRKESDGTVFNLTPGGSSDLSAKGYEILSSGLQFCWGTASCGVGVTSASDTFALAFGTIFQVITSASGVGGGKTDAQNVAFATTQTTTTATFTRSRSENAFTLRYLAIGLGV